MRTALRAQRPGARSTGSTVPSGRRRASICDRVQARRGSGAGEGIGSGPVVGVGRQASSSWANSNKSWSSGSVSSSTSRSHAHRVSPPALSNAWASCSSKGSRHTSRGFLVVSSTGDTLRSRMEPANHRGVKVKPTRRSHPTCSWPPVRSNTGWPAAHCLQGSSSSQGSASGTGSASQVA